MNSNYLCVFFILSGVYASEQNVCPTIEAFEHLKAQVEKNKQELFDVKREIQELKNGPVLTQEDIDVNKLDDSMQNLEKLVIDVLDLRDIPFNDLRKRDFWSINSQSKWTLNHCIVATLKEHIERYKKLLKKERIYNELLEKKQGFGEVK